MLELDVVKKLTPKSHRCLITQEFIDEINAMEKDSEIAEIFKENFITYLNVLQEGRYKMKDYISAVKYVSFKLLGYSNSDAYVATFPERSQLKFDRGATVDSFASMYNKTKLVNLIYQQTMVPTYILNAPLHQKAINTLAEMIEDPNVRGMTKVKACEAILNYTKPPEVIEGKLTVNVDTSSTINELRDISERLANTFREAVEKNNSSLKEIAESNIIDVSIEE